MDRAKVLLVSLVSATRFVASAVAVRVAPPLAAVQLPPRVTFAVAPGAMAGVVPPSVVEPTVSRVTVPALTALVPRLCTATVKVTVAPTAGLAGVEEMERTSRSGPGLWPTTSGEAVVRLLLVSSDSTTVSVGSTSAETVYDPCGRLPTSTETGAEAPAARGPTGALPTTTPPRLTLTVVAGEAAEPALRTVPSTVMSSVSDGDDGLQDSALTVRSGLGAAVPRTWISAIWAPGASVLEKNFSRTSATRASTGMVTVFWLEPGLNTWPARSRSEENAVPSCVRPSTWMSCVRVAQTGSGLSLTTTDSTSASAPSFTVRSAGWPLDSQ